MYKQIRQANVSFPSPHWDLVSPACKDFILAALQPDPEKVAYPPPHQKTIIFLIFKPNLVSLTVN